MPTQERAQLDYQNTNGSSPDGAVTAATIRDRWDQSQKASAKERRAYWINSAFCGGEQWVAWNNHTGSLDYMPPDGDRLQLTENRIWPSVRTLTAKLLKRPLVFEVNPTQADDAAEAGARKSQAVLADVHHRHDWEAKRHSNALLALKGGLSVLCVEWDAKAGVALGVTEDGKSFGTGDTVESVLAVTEVAAEPGSRSLETGNWWIKGTALPPKEVQQRYKLTAEPPADATASLSPLQRQLMSGGTGNANVALTLVLTYYERPNPDSKSGRMAVVVNNQIVEQSKWPFPFTDRLNCVAVAENPHDQDWLADTIVSAAISPQFALNHCISKLGEHMKLAADAKFGVPEGAGDEWDDLSDVPEVVRFFGNIQPGWIMPGAMPQWWLSAPDQFRKAIDDTLGVHDISRGESPSGVDAGIALSLLAEQDDTPLGMLAKTGAEAWGRLASLVLAIYEAKVTEPRKAVVPRGGQAPEETTWTGKDLAGQTTAVVPLTAVAPRSEAAQMELAFRIKTSFPELTAEQFYKIANLPDAADMEEATDMDLVKAQRENAEMANRGEPTMPAPFDDHATHIRVHNDFRKTARYEALSPDVRAVIDAHVQGHEVDAAREAGTQLMKANVSPALAAAPQANEPPGAGSPGFLEQARMAQNQAAPTGPGGMSSMPGVPAPGGMASEDASGQATGAPQMGGQ